METVCSAMSARYSMTFARLVSYCCLLRLDLAFSFSCLFCLDSPNVSSVFSDFSDFSLSKERESLPSPERRCSSRTFRYGYLVTT